jgi:hypothetical protein
VLSGSFTNVRQGMAKCSIAWKNPVSQPNILLLREKHNARAPLDDSLVLEEQHATAKGTSKIETKKLNIESKEFLDELKEEMKVLKDELIVGKKTSINTLF